MDDMKKTYIMNELTSLRDYERTRAPTFYEDEDTQLALETAGEPTRVSYPEGY